MESVWTCSELVSCGRESALTSQKWTPDALGEHVQEDVSHMRTIQRDSAHYVFLLWELSLFKKEILFYFAISVYTEPRTQPDKKIKNCVCIQIDPVNSSEKETQRET